MNSIEEYDDRIEQFLRGEMNAYEEAEFKDDVAADPKLQERAKMISALVLGLKRKNLADDNAVIQETMSLGKHNSGKYNIRLFITLLSAAAMLIFVFNIFTDYRRQSHFNEIVAPYYTTYSVDGNVRGEEDTQAIVELAELFNSIGSSDDCEEIVNKLEPIYQSLDKSYTYRPYETDIAWYLAIAYIKNDQLDKAEQLLNKIVKDNPNSEIAEKSSLLVKKVKNIE